MNVSTIFVISMVSTWTSTTSFAANPPASSIYGGTIQRQTMTFAVRGDAEMRTFSSQAADSKESQAASTVSMSMWTGEGRNLGVTASSTDTTVPFSLNKSETRHSFKEVRLQGRFGPLFVSGIGSLTQVAVSRAEGKYFDVSGTGVGAGVGFAAPIHSNIVAYGDGSLIQTASAFDRNGHKASIGNRTEGELGAVIDVTARILDVVVGYKTRSFSVQIDDENFNETSQGAFAGVRVGAYF